MAHSMSYPFVVSFLGGWLVTLLLPIPAVGAEPAPSFFRGLNLNGRAVTIDGHTWEGRDSKQYVCQDKAFENQSVPLVPATDPERAAMIRSSRWGGNRVELLNIPGGAYSLFLYVWEDNNDEVYSIAVNGAPVATEHHSGSAGHWQKLGPWFVVPSGGKIVITSQGGAANFSGLELWRGRYDGLPLAIRDEDLAFFERRIRPLLVGKCYECHSEEAAELQGDLLVDSRATLRRGGATGPAILPGDLANSLLIEAVRYENPDLRMPPEEKLTDEEIADLERWVMLGAPDPRVAATKHVGKRIDLAAAQRFWSLRPLDMPTVPTIGDSAWPRTNIDRFILASLEKQGLKPAPDADKRTLIRRATYDLTGLPPTPAEVASFLSDDSTDAFARVVDRLLDSPRYGERWGRHWLDVVRYADTAGDNSDYPIPQMHHYRDWVIDAFQRDLPYDEFIRDQLAGDLRGGDTEEQRRQRVIATGYLANARRFGSRVDDYPWHLTIEDTIDNLGKVFLGLSLSCARCHDHKFDPFTMRDYYGLYGIFSSTRYPWPGIELDKRQRDLVPLVSPDRVAELERRQAERANEQKRLDAEVAKRKESLKKAATDSRPEAERALQEAERRAKEHRGQAPLFESAYAVAEASSTSDVPIQIKGNPSRLGDVVRRRFPEVLGGGELPETSSTSGRRELAEWLTAVNNPLPARVMANRIWLHHFGRGLVATPNDFGRQGQPPSHPELLEYLARQFRDSGWSIKSLHRLIMSSRVYQQSSRRDAIAIETDPANHGLAGFPRRRLDAESLRDTLLVLGGNLDLSPAGPHPFPAQETWDFTQHKPFKAVYESRKRSVYLMTPRIQRHPFLAVFDGADPSTSTPARLTSTTPLQALFLLNDPFLHDQARRIAERLWEQAPDADGRVASAYELLLARPATADEQAAAREFLASAQTLVGEAGGVTVEGEREAWRAYVRTLLRLNEFVYVE